MIEFARGSGVGRWRRGLLLAVILALPWWAGCGRQADSTAPPPGTATSPNQWRILPGAERDRPPPWEVGDDLTGLPDRIRAAERVLDRELEAMNRSVHSAPTRRAGGSGAD